MPDPFCGGDGVDPLASLPPLLPPTPRTPPPCCTFDMCSIPATGRQLRATAGPPQPLAPPHASTTVPAPALLGQAAQGLGRQAGALEAAQGATGRKAAAPMAACIFHPWTCHSSRRVRPGRSFLCRGEREGGSWVLPGRGIGSEAGKFSPEFWARSRNGPRDPPQMGRAGHPSPGFGRPELWVGVRRCPPPAAAGLRPTRTTSITSLEHLLPPSFSRPPALPLPPSRPV